MRRTTPDKQEIPSDAACLMRISRKQLLNYSKNAVNPGIRARKLIHIVRKCVIIIHYKLAVREAVTISIITREVIA